jgi:hypothetical protein
MPLQYITLLTTLQDDFSKCVSVLMKIDPDRIIARTTSYVKTLVTTFKLDVDVHQDESIFAIKMALEQKLYELYPIRIANIIRSQNKIIHDMVRCSVCPCYVVCKCDATDKLWQCKCIGEDCKCDGVQLCKCTYNVMATFNSTQTCECVTSAFDVEL